MYELKKLSEGKYWDEACNPDRIKCKCEVQNCWYHILANRHKWSYGWFPEQLDKVSLKGKPKVFAVNWSGDLGWKTVRRDHTYHTLTRIAHVQDCREEYKLKPHTFLFLSKWPENLVDIFPPFKDVPGIWIGTTITGQDKATDKKRVNSLLKFKGFKKWVSIEPLLAPINPHSLLKLNKLDQVIIGVDSSPNAKQTDWIWAYDTRLICWGDVPVFVKQLHINGKLSKNINDWPKDLRVRELVWNK